MAVSFKPAISAVALAATLGFGQHAVADPLTENFDTGVPAGWTAINLSNPPGALDWFQGNPGAFSAQQGAADSYAAVNFESGDGVADLSTWLVLPTSTYRNGDTLSFYTRTAEGSIWPDRLEVRFSNVGGTNVGASETSVGTFTTLLISINPTLDLGVYPEAWTRYSTTLSGLSGPTSGAFAFRYSVTDGGPDGFNSNYIGIDTLQVTGVAAIPEPSTYVLMMLGLGLVGWMGKRRGGYRIK